MATAEQLIADLKQELADVRERLSWLEGAAFRPAVAEGLADKAAGRVVPHETIAQDMANRRRAARDAA